MKLYTMALVIALAACGKDTQKGPPLDPPPATTGDAATAETGSGSADGSAAGSDSAVADVDVPTPMDYEELANEEITDKTVEARLKDLESELAPL